VSANNGTTYLQKGFFSVLRPLADRVVVKPIQAEEKTKAGLFFRIPPRTNRKREK
jgi:co-chaperonin GroES (HSP10)